MGSTLVYGTLVKGDAYLVAGSGSIGTNGFPGATTFTTGGSATVQAVTNPVTPTSLAFDNTGNLLIAGQYKKTGTVNSGIQMVAKAACAASCHYKYSTLVAGGLYTLAATGATKGVTRTPAVVYTVSVAGYGLAVDSLGDIVEGGSGQATFINEGTSTLKRYGQTIPPHTGIVIAGTPTGGTATCGSGAKNAPATGTSTPKFQWPHPVFDAAGNVYINDDKATASHGCTWVLPATTGSLDGQTMTAGKVYSLTGAGTTTAATNGVLANTHSFPNTNAVAVDPAGNVVLGSAGTVPSLRVIAEATGTYYDQAMTKGDVYIIAGGPTASRTTTPGNATGFKFSGAAIPATAPAFGVTSLTTGALGDLLLTDGASRTTGTLYLVTKGPTAAPPTVTKVTPSRGKAAGGTTITVTGTGFTTVTHVKFGTRQAGQSRSRARPSSRWSTRQGPPAWSASR